jgi:hypothetical protein
MNKLHLSHIWIIIVCRKRKLLLKKPFLLTTPGEINKKGFFNNSNLYFKKT